MVTKSPRERVRPRRSLVRRPLQARRRHRPTRVMAARMGAGRGPERPPALQSLSMAAGAAETAWIGRGRAGLLRRSRGGRRVHPRHGVYEAARDRPTVSLGLPMDAVRKSVPSKGREAMQIEVLAIAVALATPIAGLAQQPEGVILQPAERVAVGMELQSDASGSRRSRGRTWAELDMIAAGGAAANRSGGGRAVAARPEGPGPPPSTGRLQ